MKILDKCSDLKLQEICLVVLEMGGVFKEAVRENRNRTKFGRHRFDCVVLCRQEEVKF